MTPQITVMSGKLGDIFWDLPPWMTYMAGFDLGCNIYVANPTDTEKEYALMAKLTRDTTVISEEALPVFGFTWFKVDPGDFMTLKGALRFTESNADLTVSLIERESGEATDSVATRLVEPTTSALPPAWPGTPGTTTTSPGFDWSSLLGTMFPFMMLGIVAMSVIKPDKKDRVAAAPAVAEKLLTQGRER